MLKNYWSNGLTWKQTAVVKSAWSTDEQLGSCNSSEDEENKTVGSSRPFTNTEVWRGRGKYKQGFKLKILPL